MVVLSELTPEGPEQVLPATGDSSTTATPQGQKTQERRQEGTTASILGQTTAKAWGRSCSTRVHGGSPVYMATTTSRRSQTRPEHRQEATEDSSSSRCRRTITTESPRGQTTAKAWGRNCSENTRAHCGSVISTTTTPSPRSKTTPEPRQEATEDPSSSRCRHTITTASPRGQTTAKAWGRSCSESTRVHGTTNFGFRYKHGIILSVDARTFLADDLNHIASDTENKFFMLSKKYFNLFCTKMGHGPAWDKMYKKVVEEIDILEVFSGHVKVSEAAEIVERYMKDLTEEIDIVFGTLIGGWEQEEGFQLRMLEFNHSVVKNSEEIAACIGYGSLFADDFIVTAKNNYSFTTTEASELALKLHHCAAYFSGFTGGIIKVYQIGEGTCDDLHIVRPLELMYTCDDLIDTSVILFLLYDKKEGYRFGTNLKELWPHGTPTIAHRVAELKDYYFHRLCFASSEDASKAFSYAELVQCAHQDSRLEKSFIALMVAEYSIDVCVYVARSSKTVIEDIWDEDL